MPIGVLSSYWSNNTKFPILLSQAGWGIFLQYIHPHFTGNNKGLYATMKRWRIDP